MTIPSETIACGDGIDDPSHPYSGSNSVSALSVMYLRAEPFRHNTSFGIAWVDGHVSHVININKKAPYSSKPFQNGDGDKIGAANNYWDRD